MPIHRIDKIHAFNYSYVKYIYKEGYEIMKKSLIILFITVLTIFGLVACAQEDANVDDAVSESIESEDIVETEVSELTLYANGGIIWMGSEEPYEADLTAATLESEMTFGEAIGDEIQSVEKDGAEFEGWIIYAVKDGEWVQEDVADLADGELCVACGDYGFYYMKDYEVITETATTEDLVAYENDGRNYYVLANWK